MKLILLITLLIPVQLMASIYSIKDKTEISELEFLKRIPVDQFNIVMGEFHYNQVIQSNQAKFIDIIVRDQSLQGAFSLGWEFLEYKYQNDIDLALNSYESKDISWDQFISRSIPGSSNKHNEYKSIIDTVIKNDGQLIATNATRLVKQNLMENGQAVLDIIDTPDVWFNPTINYFNRFEIAMGGHADPIALKKYFLAQHYTDAIISSKLNDSSLYKHRFLVIGSFHSDFFDGVNRYLKGNNILIKFVDRSLYSTSEWEALKVNNPKFGIISDYLIY
jgi:hypothetical protein